MKVRVGLITILLVAGLAACAPKAPIAPQPTPKPQTEELSSVTAADMVPTLTATSIPTHILTATSSSTPIPLIPTRVKDISAPQRTSTPLEPTPKPTPFPLGFKDEIEVVSVLGDTRSIAWSPTYHEFVKDSCTDDDEMIIELISLEKSSRVIITPAKIACYFLSVLWHPSGEYFFFSGEVLPQDGYELGQTYGWQMSRDAQSISDIGPISPNRGWLSEQLYVSEDRVGTGVYAINIFNAETEKRISGTLFDGVVKAISENFVILNEELGYSYNTSAAVLAQEPISPEYNGWLFGSDIKFFGKRLNDSGWEISYYSRFADVLPHTDQVLVVTWEEPLLNELDSGQLISGTIPSNLQLLHAQTDEVTMVLPGGIYGRFSPNGSIIAAMTPDEAYPNLQLFSYPDGKNFLSLPAYAEAADYSAEVVAFTTFSPNGRYFTFFTPETDLVIYDLETGEMLPPLTAVPHTPLWSPDSTRFVYTDPLQGLAIYDTRSHTAYPLAVTGGERLSTPQWSFDGTYLSVVYKTAEDEWQTAVLSLP